MRKLALVMSVMMASGAWASPDAGARVAAEARIDAWFDCIVKADPVTAAAVALDTRYDGGFSGRVEKLRRASARCLDKAGSDAGRMTGILFRGGLARAFWMAGVAAPAAYVPPSGPVSEAARTAAANEAGLAGYAGCVLDAAPGPAADFARARAGSEAEKAAFAAMDAPLTACLKPETPLPVSGDRLRAGLALMLYGRSAG
ncbi:hypothetical protein [Sandaracinobacteroides saxicola]|uniref:Lysozyme inhibitor LprI N-terminal domain-containing protein n=1 Tax=Sandaracinobacteroides saxicola TaxID=2759707 RepID=A0A7G5IEQ8_9SPHN|nr:hypothetical protein [Sandaracinobacteroides saxicola]QMW21850.1 hypothetical protein H3309_10635 [Sandaracinobacteroides saxicola]